jgi:pyruvate dehydrogenase E1 component alpha subunit
MHEIVETIRAPLNVPPDVCRGLYRGMLRIRRIEERIAELYPQQEMRCPTHLCIGQEAPAVGVCAWLTENDYALSGHRSHGHYLAKGGSMRAMVAELYCRATGCSAGRGGSMHLVDLSCGFLAATPIVGSTIPIGVGAAWGSRLQGKPRLVVIFLGDAAVEEGVWHESMNFAALHRLPVLFVCENNLYSVYTRIDQRQPANRTLLDLALSHGIEGARGDGNDVLSVYDMARTAVEHARQHGPYFLELATYRWREHCGPYFDNDLGYRTVAEYEQWRARCPLERLRAQLLESGTLSEAELSEVAAQVEAEVEDAVNFARHSPWPAIETLFDHVYAPSGGQGHE